MTGMDSILPLKTRDSQRKPCKPMVPVSPASPLESIFPSLLLSCFPRGALRVFCSITIFLIWESDKHLHTELKGAINSPRGITF